jgi:hypothetical protein
MNVHGAVDAACRRIRAITLRRATMTNVASLKSARIRVLNDNFRSTFLGGQVVFSSGVAGLPIAFKAQLVVNVENFADFNEDNDPFGEHDFGSFELAGETFFWKIDLYEEPDVKGANEEPVVTRVLTIMLAEEY